jgi:hypothetical protein
MATNQVHAVTIELTVQNGQPVKIDTPQPTTVDKRRMYYGVCDTPHWSTVLLFAFQASGSFPQNAHNTHSN